MDREFYEYLFKLRSSGFHFTTDENSIEQFSAMILTQSSVHMEVSGSGLLSMGGGLDGGVGFLSESRIRSIRNCMIAVITSQLQIARDMYVDLEKASVLAEYYFSKVEQIDSAQSLVSFSSAMFRDFGELFQSKPWRSYGRIIDKCIRYVEQNLYSPLTVGQVADYVGYSSSHLSDLFKKSTGYSLYSFIQQKKLIEATELLVFTSQSLTSIASSLGYHSLSHFSKAFKKYIGMTPSHFRRYPPIRPQEPRTRLLSEMMSYVSPYVKDAEK